MADILIGTERGCLVFHEHRSSECELPGRNVGPFAAEVDGSCLAVVDQREIWRRSMAGKWTQVAALESTVQSLLVSRGDIYVGGLNEATLLAIDHQGHVSRLTGFDEVPGRSEWFAGGPPLGVRSLAVSQGGETLLAAVHVGGIPRSTDRGTTWTPTIPVRYDVHEIRAHPSRPDFVAAATAVGLCVSRDGGQTWKVIAEGLSITNSLAVAVLESEILFSVQDGPFPKRSQVWRCPIDGSAVERVRQGLPEWLEGKVDTAQIGTGRDRAAICDGGGNLWVSQHQTSGWRRVAEGIGYANGVLIV